VKQAGKLVLQMRRGILKTAISDFHRRGGGWTSNCDNIAGTSIIMSLKSDEVDYINTTRIRVQAQHDIASSMQ